ncbi:MAG: NUDIX domain-containing protein [Gaiellales bacterium]
MSEPGLPGFSTRVRCVIVDGEGRVLMDRTHHPDRDVFYWVPGGGLDAGETSEEGLRRELMEEAALEIEVGRLLYVSENLFVESGDYRHEVILYFLARITGGPVGEPVDRRMHEWHRPGDQPGRLLPSDVAAAVEADLAEGFTRPVLHLVTDERPVLRGGSSAGTVRP